MLNTLARCNEKCIHVKTAYADKDLCKSIPGSRWDPGMKEWTYPLSPSSAKNIYLKFGKRLLGDKTFADLLKAAYKTDEIKIAAEKNQLDQIPVTKMSPWKHQLLAYHMVKNQPATMLALSMGTGKTKVVIDVIQNSPELKKILVISPLSVVRVWANEFKKHYALGKINVFDRDPVETLDENDVFIVPLDDGGVKGKMENIFKVLGTVQFSKARLVVVTNYESVWREPLKSWLLKNPADLCVCDEIHKIKSPGGKSSRFLSELGNVVQKRIGLTGTPMPHSPLDIYGEYRFLDKAIFGTSFAAFRDYYAIMGGYGNYQILGYKNQDEMNKKFYSIALRVGNDVLDLPPIIEEERYCKLDTKAKKIYDDLEKYLVSRVGDGTVTAANGLTLLLRLQQLTGGYLPQDEDLQHQEKTIEEIDTSKATLLEDIIDDVDEKEPVVVFCRFTQDIKTVKKVAEKLGRKSFEITGQKKEIEEWQKDTTGSVIAVQIQAGGLGIDLTRAHYCIYYSVGFSLGDYEQSQARIHRPGQKETVTYIKLISEGTVDEEVYTALKEKENVVESVLKQISTI